MVDQPGGRLTVQLSRVKHSLPGSLVIVVGAGRSGLAAARLAGQKGARVRLVDKNELDPVLQARLVSEGVEVVCGPHCADHFAGAGLIVLSPGVNRQALESFLPKGVMVVGELELASWFVDQETVIGVTGSNGKTTTVGLIAHILEHAGKSVFLGGNYGPPLADYVLGGGGAEVLVLELSSFQLAQVKSFRASIAVFLNFSPNHLDYHQDEDEYFYAKLQLFVHQKEQDVAIYDQSVIEKVSDLGLPARTKLVIQSGPVLQCPSLVGPHNRHNIKAAALVCQQLGLSIPVMAQGVRTFRPQPHRLQLVGEHKGIMFFDDSKATTVEALEAALQSFTQPVLLLAGGRFKGGEPARIRPLIKERVRMIGLFGEGKDLFANSWQGCADIFWCPSLEESAWRLFGQARSGEVVLLSPAAASFDLFASYQQRGLAFQQAVQDWRQQMSRRMDPARD